MNRTLAALFTATLLAGSTLMLSACNATAGAGQDISSAGHAVTNAADGAKQ
jgi:predicted small secreted protein